jgi:phenylalanyl-tRNA synthetase beta chain
MKISLNWLKEFVDIPVPADVLGQNITNVGLAVDSREDEGGDTIFELDITTNRPDCLSHLGMAREVAAIFGSALRRPQFSVNEGRSSAADVFSVQIADASLCGRYCGRYIGAVRIGPSPEWLKARLEALGVRPINNVADITNYVMLELGQPMHAFDADKLEGRRIVVRAAAAGETLQTLDGVERKLNPSILVIADARRPVALAGIMGGEDTEISSSTVNVFLESAWFQPKSIRKTARLLGMNTEASYRFERGADVEMAAMACDRAAALISELAGGTIFRGLIDAFPAQAEPVHCSLRRSRIAAFLGAPVDDAIVEGIFDRLEFKYRRQSDGWSVAVPSFRVDVSGEVDLLEEIARHHGYHRFPFELPPARSAGAPLPSETRLRALRQVLMATGYSEIYTYSFSDEAEERRFYPDIEPVRLANPMSEEASIMRTSLVPSMLRAIQRNLNRNVRNLQLYELGKVYSKQGERRSLILAACGNIRLEGVHAPAREFDFFDMKGDVEQILDLFSVPVGITGDNIPQYFHPGRFARCGHIARFGELHPQYADALKLKQRVYLAEVDIEMLLAIPKTRQVRPVPRYPAVRRDLSLLLDKGTQYGAVAETIGLAGITELIRVEPFDRMLAGPFPENKYSLSISVVYQSADRTLTDVEVEGFDRKLMDILETRLGAQLRK